MVVVKVKNIRSKIENLTDPNCLEEIVKALSWTDPKIYFVRRHIRYSRWDGTIRTFNKKTKTFPTGNLERVLEILQKYSLQYQIEDYREKPPPAKRSVKLKKFKPYPYQKKAIEAICSGNGYGNIFIGTGGGKSLVLATIIGKLNLPTNIFVHTQELLDQMKNNITKYLGVKAGQIGGGEVDIKKFNVCMMQTVSRLYKEKYIKFGSEKSTDETIVEGHEDEIKNAIENAKVLVIDESHHSSTQSLRLIARRSPNAWYRIGASGTPMREDKADILVEGVVGPKVIEVTTSNLIEQGYLVPPHIYFFQLPPPEGTIPMTYGEVYQKYIVRRDCRNKIIAETTKKLYDKNYKTLVLVGRIEHGELLKKMIPSSKFIHSSTLDREKIFFDFKEGLLKTCIATSQLFGEGIDIPSLQAVILADGGKSVLNFYQKIGRALRPYKEKKRAVVIDFVDNEIKYLYNHSKKRINHCKKEPKFVIKIQKNPYA